MAADYEPIVYAKGALFFATLRDEIGQEAFRTLLRTYLERYRWRIATPQSCVALANEVSGKDLSGMFSRGSRGGDASGLAEGNCCQGLASAHVSVLADFADLLELRVPLPANWHLLRQEEPFRIRHRAGQLGPEALLRHLLPHPLGPVEVEAAVGLFPLAHDQVRVVARHGEARPCLTWMA